MKLRTRPERASEARPTNDGENAEPTAPPGSTEEAPPEARRAAQRAVDAFEAAAEAEQGTRARQQMLDEARVAAGDSALAVAYGFLQRLVGFIAVLLPATVAVGNMLFDGFVLEDSISAYYYTRMGNVFVGALCALGVFFLSYQHDPLPGYRLDNQLSYGASAAAIGVAVFPTAEHEAEAWTGEWLVSTLHLLCACALFVLLAIFSLKLFTRTDPDKPISRTRERRNKVFRVCGRVIVAVIVLVIVENGLGVDTPESWHALFWLETAGVVAFGISWLVKSGAFGILTTTDPPPV